MKKRTDRQPVARSALVVLRDGSCLWFPRAKVKRSRTEVRVRTADGVDVVVPAAGTDCLTRLGKRVLCTDRHSWTTERLVTALRGQWNVEEIFRRSKKGGVVPWGPSHQWADASLRVHTFATVLGLMLVSLARLALGTSKSARQMMRTIAEIEATQVRTTAGGMGRRPTWLLAPDITPWQERAIKTFELGRWMPELLSDTPARGKRPENHAVA